MFTWILIFCGVALSSIVVWIVLVLLAALALGGWVPVWLKVLLAFVAVGLTSILPLAYLPPAWTPEILLRLIQALSGIEGWSALYTWRAAADLLLGSLRPLAMGFLAGLGASVVFGFAADSGLLVLDAYRPQHQSMDPEPRVASLFFLSGWLAEYIVVPTPVALAAVVMKAGRWRRFAPALLALRLVD